MGGSAKSVRFVTRDGCTVCQEARVRLSGPARLMRIEIVEVDVDADPDLLDKYSGRVPVVLAADGTILAEGRMTKRDSWRAAWTARRV